MKLRTILLLIIFLAILLRISWLGTIPNSLYTDEIDQGYNAFSILKTGRDEHGSILPISLRSFGDWKPPLPTYLMIPFISILGLTEDAVRLPSIVLGIFSLVLAYRLVLSLFPGRNYKLALFCSFFLAISPWHILQSRAAMLVMIALFFYLSGIYFFTKALQKNTLFILSFLSFSFSVYSYYGLRLIVPFTIIFLFLFYRKNINFLSRSLVFGATTGLVILLPLVINFFQKPDVVFGRVKTVSIFYDQGIKLRKWELITQDGLADTLLTQFFHNNYFLYTRDIIRRFLSHFDGRYLFLQGDTVDPFRIPSMGIFYFADSLFMIIGAYKLYITKSPTKYFLLFWLIIAIVPASLTFITPSSNRSFNAIFPLVLFISLGMTLISRRIVLAALVCIIYIISFAYFLNQYFINLSNSHADWWRYELKHPYMPFLKRKNTKM